MAEPAVTPPPTFRRRTLIMLIGFGVVSLGVALWLAAFADDFNDKQTAESNGYSVSAIGYRGFIELLQKSGIPVMDSQHDSARRSQGGLLVVFAPDVDAEAEELSELVRSAPRVLLVLPRWFGPADPDRPGWILERDELPTDAVAQVLTAAKIDGTLDRVSGDPKGEGPMPDIADPVQTIDSQDLDPEVAIGDHVLLGSVWIDEDTKLYVMTDPSAIDNAGLRRPGNPDFAVATIDRLREGGPVVFDETSHGFESTPSLWKALFEFPLVLVTIHAGIAALLLLWAAIGRYGPPRAALSTVPTGKDFLIRNTAELLHVGGHDADALRRYLTTTIYTVKTALHAPLDLDAAGIRTWLERVRADRGGKISLQELEYEVIEVSHAKKNRATARRIVELAARVHRWRSEMTHGPEHHP